MGKKGKRLARVKRVGQTKGQLNRNWKLGQGEAGTEPGKRCKEERASTGMVTRKGKSKNVYPRL